MEWMDGVENVYVWNKYPTTIFIFVYTFCKFLSDNLLDVWQLITHKLSQLLAMQSVLRTPLTQYAIVLMLIWWSKPRSSRVLFIKNLKSRCLILERINPGQFQTWIVFVIEKFIVSNPRNTIGTRRWFNIICTANSVQEIQ